jgi:hypothetical protein
MQQQEERQVQIRFDAWSLKVRLRCSFSVSSVEAAPCPVLYGSKFRAMAGFLALLNLTVARKTAPPQTVCWQQPFGNVRHVERAGLEVRTRVATHRRLSRPLRESRDAEFCPLSDDEAHGTAEQ